VLPGIGATDHAPCVASPRSPPSSPARFERMMAFTAAKSASGKT
jgi:hypothetical protein